jgi:hypothetical protein
MRGLVPMNALYGSAFAVGIVHHHCSRKKRLKLLSESAGRERKIYGLSLLMQWWHGAAASWESAEDLFAEPLSSP